MKIEKKLILSIERSNAAYHLYKENKCYYQALRIYKANSEIYNLLNAFFLSKRSISSEHIFNYLFHLEDWMEKFKNEEIILKPKLEDVFVFEKLVYSIEYPKEFINLLKSKI